MPALLVAEKLVGLPLAPGAAVPGRVAPPPPPPRLTAYPLAPPPAGATGFLAIIPAEAAASLMTITPSRILTSRNTLSRFFSRKALRVGTLHRN